MSGRGRSAAVDASSREPFLRLAALPSRLPRHHRAALWSFVTKGQAGGAGDGMAQTSCQLASGYPGRGVTFPGCHTTVTTHWTDRHPPPPPSPLGISTTSCGCLPMARSNEGMPQAARLHRRSRSRAGPPRNCFQEVGAMFLFPGRGLENYDATIIRPASGGICLLADESSRLPPAPAPLLPTHRASSIALFYEQHLPSSRDRVHKMEYPASFRA